MTFSKTNLRFGGSEKLKVDGSLQTGKTLKRAR